LLGGSKNGGSSRGAVKLICARSQPLFVSARERHGPQGLLVIAALSAVFQSSTQGETCTGLVAGAVQANRAAPASVNLRYVPLSCRRSQPSAMARSIPARKSSPLPPTARKRRIDALDINPTVLHGLNVVRDLDDLARGGIRIGEGTIDHELFHAANPIFLVLATHDDLERIIR